MPPIYDLQIAFEAPQITFKMLEAHLGSLNGPKQEYCRGLDNLRLPYTLVGQDASNMRGETCQIAKAVKVPRLTTSMANGLLLQEVGQLCQGLTSVSLRACRWQRLPKLPPTPTLIMLVSSCEK